MRSAPFLVSSFLPILALALVSCAGGPRPAREPAVPLRGEGFSAEYRLTWASAGTTKKARLAVAFTPPFRLRLEVVDGLGSSRAVLVATEEGALLENPIRREFRVFAAGRDALKALSGLDLDPVLLAGLMAGDPELASGIRCSAAGEADPVRKCAGPGGDPSFRILAGDRQWEVDTGGGGAIHAELDVGAGVPPAPPRRITLKGGARDGSVDLKLRSFRSGHPPEDLFSLLPPSSFHESVGEASSASSGWIVP